MIWEEPPVVIFKVEVASLEMVLSIYHKKKDVLSWKVTILSAVVVTMKSRENGVLYRKCVFSLVEEPFNKRTAR
jgi:hypothetical protein